MTNTEQTVDKTAELINKQPENHSSYDKDRLKVQAYLDLAKSFNLTTEVITTALYNIVSTPELYKNDVARSLYEALREWDCI